MEKSCRYHIVVFAVIFAFLPVLSYATEQSSCATLSSTDTYTLTQDVAATGTCFTITASDVTLDCAGYLINYSQSSSSTYGVTVSGSAHGFTIKNCRIMKGSPTTSSGYGIYISGPDKGLVQNNTVITDGDTVVDSNYGIFLSGTTDTVIYNNTVVTKGDDT
ncbi:MAG: right-handed parallel beta-helix repeat-containing protein, partial [Candidatus Aenigmarchaeota archaeon]|nr:right-handed parallel beta-helix repeat-containing protein [Candidatus Aenigmarchaeota archaeon]